ncbi:hypothetical protein [Limosilactobacillus sp.]|jgi:glycerol-3-phosphate acyltransferase PlsY|uniref:hypothetical protein n=1 Tax=Limosilactobacillus sp. TaxID=2773925 RepID=UPI0025BE2D7F|nr:hypothetical protein [Limosilactobacillus sp.]MCH3922494.1 hypothetical protein [Limosilactobacillus sp.]MCH3927176.1 hypothetical protein [Limosilactobacillus sp.]
MLIDFRQLLIELLIVIILWVLTVLWRRLSRRRRWLRVVWTLVLWLLILWNLDVYWVAYPIALWMIWALALIALQSVHNHEFLYRRYWPVFWRLSLFYALVVFAGSLFCNGLPLV